MTVATRLASLALLTPIALSAQMPAARTRVLRVSVHDSLSGAPIPRARVALSASDLPSGTSDAGGIAILRGTWRARDSVIVTAVGFRPYARSLASIAENVLALDISLVAVAQDLPAVATIESRPSYRLADFERRRTSGRTGTFLTRGDITHRASVRTTDLLRGISGLRVVDSASLKLVVATRVYTPSLVSRSAPGNYCVVPIAVDGQLREGSFQLDLLDPAEIHGIEVYTGAGSIPPEYSSMQRNAWCGLILVWTRDR